MPQAEKEYLEALSQFPQGDIEKNELGVITIAGGSVPSSGSPCGNCSRLRPDLPSLHLELGQVYANSAQWSKAETEFRAEAKLRPGSAEAAYRLGAAPSQPG